MSSFGYWISEGCVELFGRPPIGIETVPSDGSQRRFFRVYLEGESLIAMENPGNSDENDAYLEIGRHLKAHGVPVPQVYRYERARGWMLVEDLGDDTFKRAVERARDEAALFALYSNVMDVLLRFQTKAVEGFPSKWCYQGSFYDRKLMVEKESGYFLEAFLKAYCGWKGTETFLYKEFQELAIMAEGLAPPVFLMHRDFQSRNILLDDRGKVGIVDFQGARMGPPQYDVASLALDPYVDIPMTLREKLPELYSEMLMRRCHLTKEEFLQGYPVVALHRLMQALGAFSFLGKVRGKVSFLQWIPRALDHLRYLLNRNLQWPCPYLREVVEEVSPLILKNRLEGYQLGEALTPAKAMSHPQRPRA